MAGSYYNGYTKSLPRTARQPKLRLTFVDSGQVGGRERRHEVFYMERADLDAKLAVLAKLDLVTQIVVGRWKRGTGWVTE